MRTILIINKHRKIKIDIPLFGKLKWKVIKNKELKGVNANLLIIDEIVRRKYT